MQKVIHLVKGGTNETFAHLLVNEEVECTLIKEVVRKVKEEINEDWNIVDILECLPFGFDLLMEEEVIIH